MNDITLENIIGKSKVNKPIENKHSFKGICLDDNREILDEYVGEYVVVLFQSNIEEGFGLVYKPYFIANYGGELENAKVMSREIMEGYNKIDYAVVLLVSHKGINPHDNFYHVF